ncbi:MAG: hypothetical protein J6P44_01820 [Bacteroidales bacterium]|nr:hypothetical protein [Bacteroidales bacterium]
MKFKTLTIPFAAIAMLFCGNLKAQILVNSEESSHLHCIEVGLSAGIDQYRGEYHAFMDALKDLDYKMNFGLGVRYNFNGNYVAGRLHKFFDRRLSFEFGIKKMKASSNKENVGEDIMKMDIMELSLMAQYNILKYSSLRTIDNGDYPITPYIEAGMAMSGFKCDNTKDLSISADLRKADDGFSFKPVAIIGWGLKVCLYDGITLGLDGSYRFTFTDDIDHMAKPSTRNDQYYFVGAELSFNLGEIFKKNR